MATWAYPFLPPDQLQKAEEETLARELEWLLHSLQDSLASLKEGLEECAALLAPTEPGSTLVLSSLRSESVKGYITRVGTKFVKGDIQLRLSSLPPPRGTSSTRLCVSSAPAAPELVLPQLTFVRGGINDSLDVIDVSTWTGDPMNASFISGQLRLLQDSLLAARQTLKGDNGEVKKQWLEGSAHESSFDPPLPPYLSFHLSVCDAAIILYLRTLEPISPAHTPTAYFAPEVGISGFSLRDKLFGSKYPSHDEAGEVFTWNGESVKVKEKVRIESQDPNLMAAMAKLTALEYEVAKWRAALSVVMGEEETDSE